jgi:hypothetical protein
MRLLDRILPVEGRRMKMSLLALLLNYIVFAFGIIKGSDLAGLGGGLALVNTPIISWMVSESIRPTGNWRSTKTTTTVTTPKTGTVKETIKNE